MDRSSRQHRGITVSLNHDYAEIRNRLKDGYGSKIIDRGVNLGKTRSDDPLEPIRRQMASLGAKLDDMILRLTAVERKLTPDPYPSGPCGKIIDMMLKQENLHKVDLLSSRRDTGISRLRLIGYYLCCICTNQTVEQIGIAWGRDRTTILYGRNKIEEMRKADKALDQFIRWYQKRLEIVCE